jgi:hypothetical protein
MVCFDLDGVLVKYEIDGYKFEDDGGPEFLKPGYFANRVADDMMLSVFKKCLKMCPKDTYIVTGIPNPSYEIRNGIILDKLSWLSKEVPEFDFGTHFIASTSDKMTLIEWIRESSITKKDVLIDDWNPNLYSWAARGGTAIKYLNGLNSKSSWVGPTLSCSSTADTAFTNLMDIVIKAR